MRTQIIQLTSIRHAFENIQVKASAYKGTGGAIIAGLIHDKLASNAGVNKGPAWNANLSFKTAQHLDAPNFDPVRTEKRYAEGGKVHEEKVSVWHQRAWSTGTYNKMCA